MEKSVFIAMQADAQDEITQALDEFVALLERVQDLQAENKTIEAARTEAGVSKSFQYSLGINCLDALMTAGRNIRGYLYGIPTNQESVYEWQVGIRQLFDSKGK